MNGWEHGGMYSDTRETKALRECRSKLMELDKHIELADELLQRAEDYDKTYLRIAGFGVPTTSLEIIGGRTRDFVRHLKRRTEATKDRLKAQFEAERDAAKAEVERAAAVRRQAYTLGITALERND